MARLLCWVGRHSWTIQVAEGESYKVCSECGKIWKASLGPDSGYSASLDSEAEGDRADKGAGGIG